MDFYRKFFRCLYRTVVLFYPVGVPGVGAGGAGGCVRSCWWCWWCSFILSGLMFPGGVAAVAGGVLSSCRGLFAFYTLPCLVFLPNIWKKFKPGGGWCSVFVEKTNKEKKTRKRVKIFIKSVDTDTVAC